MRSLSADIPIIVSNVASITLQHSEADIRRRSADDHRLPEFIGYLRCLSGKNTCGATRQVNYAMSSSR